MPVCGSGQAGGCQVGNPGASVTDTSNSLIRDEHRMCPQNGSNQSNCRDVFMTGLLGGRRKGSTIYPDPRSGTSASLAGFV